MAENKGTVCRALLITHPPYIPEWELDAADDIAVYNVGGNVFCIKDGVIMTPETTNALAGKSFCAGRVHCVP